MGSFARVGKIGARTIDSREVVDVFRLDDATRDLYVREKRREVNPKRIMRTSPLTLALNEGGGRP